MKRSTTTRGYGSPHRALRAEWAPLVATGRVPCARCGVLIPAGSEWDLGHDDHDRRVYRGPEHATCNRSAGGQAGNKRRRSVRSRVW